MGLISFSFSEEGCPCIKTEIRTSEAEAGQHQKGGQFEVFRFFNRCNFFWLKSNLPFFFEGDLNWKIRFFILATTPSGQTTLSYCNGAVSCDTFKGMTVSSATGICAANNDQKGIYELKNYSLQSLEDNFVTLVSGYNLARYF